MNRYAIAAIYCLAVFVANLTAATFMPLPLFGLVAVGTLFFGATFTLRDYAHLHGRRFVYGMIAVAALVNVAGALLTDTPLRIVAASFLSIVIAESADTEVYHRLRARAWMVRVMGSNAVSIPLDTVLFTTVAFVGVLPWIDFAALIWGDTLAKFAIGFLVGAARLRLKAAPAVA